VYLSEISLSKRLLDWLRNFLPSVGILAHTRESAGILRGLI
jgi:hypothetical protein